MTAAEIVDALCEAAWNAGDEVVHGDLRKADSLIARRDRIKAALVAYLNRYYSRGCVEYRKLEEACRGK